MRRLTLVTVAFTMLLALARAENSDTPAAGDVMLALNCPASPCLFQVGEVIQLNLSVTARIAGYTVASLDGSPQSATESFTATPVDQVGDPLNGATIGRIATGIFGFRPLVPGRPFSVAVELNEWIRFEGPGKYRVTARSSRVHQEGQRVPIDLTAAPIDIEIVAAKPQWQKEQLARIVAELPGPGAGYSPTAAAAVRALGYLRSEEAVSEIRKRVGALPYLTQDFREQYARYLVAWEMARLEAARHVSSPSRY